MSDFVLRGFCKKCEQPIKVHDYGTIIEDGRFEPTIKHWEFSPDIDCEISIDCEIEPVWFLSARQIDIIYQFLYLNSGKFYKKELEEYWLNEYPDISKLLIKNPFLVSKILKDAEEKEQVKKE